MYQLEIVKELIVVDVSQRAFLEDVPLKTTSSNEVGQISLDQLAQVDQRLSDPSPSQVRIAAKEIEENTMNNNTVNFKNLANKKHDM